MTMKKIILSICSTFIICYSLQARVLTVSNVPGSLAMFKDIQPAIDSAKVGDTVFVHASKDMYALSGTVFIKKRIVLIGEGGKPNYTSLAAILYNQLQIDSLAGIPVSGVIINGLQFSSGVQITTQIKGVIIKNCNLANCTFAGIGHTIVNNIISTVSLGTNCIFSNNITQNYIGSGDNCVISNNIFVNPDNSGGVRNMNACTVVNNIFLTSLNTISGGTGNSFSKNIQGGTDLPAGNFTNVQPANIFIESTVGASMTNAQVLTSSWKHKTTSVGKNAGTDGKEIGLYGGNFPWPSNKIFNGDPGLPKVEMLEVQNSVVEPNGTIKINFKAKSASKK